MIRFINPVKLPLLMQNNINPDNSPVIEGGVSDKMGKKVLIATLYHKDAVVFTITKLGPEKIILVIDKKPDDVQKKSLSEIRAFYANTLEIIEEKTDPFDVVEIAKSCVDIIDKEQKAGNSIYANITSGYKTKAIGLLLACYARHDFVKKIAYNPYEDKNKVVYLPRLSLKLTESQKSVLEQLEAGCTKATEIAEKLKISTAMTYRAIGELEDMDMIDENEDNTLCITDAGKIARL
jgi:CRISPR locus-related DNA-binding protein